MAKQKGRASRKDKFKTKKASSSLSNLFHTFLYHIILHPVIHHSLYRILSVPKTVHAYTYICVREWMNKIAFLLNLRAIVYMAILIFMSCVKKPQKLSNSQGLFSWFRLANPIPTILLTIQVASLKKWTGCCRCPWQVYISYTLY